MMLFSPAAAMPQVKRRGLAMSNGEAKGRRQEMREFQMTGRPPRRDRQGHGEHIWAESGMFEITWHSG